MNFAGSRPIFHLVQHPVSYNNQPDAFARFLNKTCRQTSRSLFASSWCSKILPGRILRTKRKQNASGVLAQQL